VLVVDLEKATERMDWVDELPPGSCLVERVELGEVDPVGDC
jgi:hypothetical protein